ncbi:MAG: dipeptidase [Lentisphaeria bacterium]|nr:dipeptidase [Lentisphaeria bacterium]
MEARWRKIRQAALNVLRPSEKDLRHGLELHRESPVFDAYGFMPVCRFGQSARIEAMIAAGADRDEVNWAKEAFGSAESFEDPDILRQLREAWDFSGVDAVFQNSGQEGNDIEVLLNRLSCYTFMIDRHPDLYERAVFPGQLPGIRERGRRAMYFTTNGVPLPSRLTSLETALGYIEVFARLGVRMMHLTYNRRNLIGDGCAESADAGLSDFGRAVIAEMNRVGVIPDVAHSGQRTSIEAARVSRKPVVASHAVAGHFSTHYRAKCDEAIAAVKDSGGFVGICGHPPFLQGSMYLDAMLDHIEYIARKFGVDHVAIGTDNGVSLGAGRPALPGRPGRPVWESYWPGPGAGYELMSEEQYHSVNFLNWPMYTVGLVQRGFTDAEIRKIIGGNVVRVMTETIEG